MYHVLIDRVAELADTFDLDGLMRRGESADDIKRYYRDSWIGYRLFHSREGSIHMSLSDKGKYEPSGVYRVLDLIQERLPPNAQQVLELGAGNGFNIRILARRTPDVEYIGIDLLDRQVRVGRRALMSLANARMRLGDFENLDFESGRFDAVFAIESLCHARNIDSTLDSILRVMRPHGRLIVVDAWRTGSYNFVAPEVKQAVELTERAMSVSSTLTQGEWIDRAQRAGLELVERRPLREEVLPNLERFEKAASLALRHRRTIKFGSHFISMHLLTNIVAGYLMAETVRAGLHCYDIVVLKKTD